MITRHFKYITDRIAAAQCTANTLAADEDHRGIEGEIREIAARECVMPFLTQSFQCGTGKVIDSLQGLSDQIDLLVYHRRSVPPILIDRDLGLFPIECVRYVFEIKSRLTAAEIRDANKKFESIVELSSFQFSATDGSPERISGPSTVLLAFDSDIVGDELERYLKHTPSTGGTPPCIAICVLGKGYWFFDTQDRRWYGRARPPEDPPFAEFAHFIGGLMNTLASAERDAPRFAPGHYVLHDDVIFPPLTPADPR